MKNENEKKGLLGRLIGGKKENNCCCGNFRIEEIPEEADPKKNESNSTQNSNCCNK